MRTTTISVNEETSQIFRDLSEKTKIPLMDLMAEIAKAVKEVIEDGMPESERINFMAKGFVDKNAVVLYFANMFCGVTEESLEETKRKLSIK